VKKNDKFIVMVISKNINRGGQYLPPNIAEFANMSEIFWQKNSRYIENSA
jgi:hypothetical protein